MWRRVQESRSPKCRCRQHLCATLDLIPRHADVYVVVLHRINKQCDDINKLLIYGRIGL